MLGGLPPGTERRTALVALFAIALAACSGVPMRTVAKLAIAGSDEILGAEASDLRVAIDVDARVKVKPGRAPVLDVVLVADSGVRHSWAIMLEPDPVAASAHGLRTPRADRHWLTWRLPESGAREFREMQALLRPMIAKKEVGSLQIKVRQDWIGDGWPTLRGDRIETWVRTRRADGFYELWSGRVGDAMERA